MKIQKLAAIALAAVPAALALTYSADANACGWAVSIDLDSQQVARAEKALEDGNNFVAAKTIFTMFPFIRDATAGEAPLQTRALRVLALAIVRTNGRLNEKQVGIASETEWTPNANLEWAVQAMREIDEVRPNDPTVQADLGEALSKLPHTRQEALSILQRLAQRDLMGSPYAYAALAKLRSDQGDVSGAEAALKRCEELSRKPSLCYKSTFAPPKSA
jgi:tetratricopeptide (TPR) repeat protein